MLFPYIIISLYHSFSFLEWWLPFIYTLYMNEWKNERMNERMKEWMKKLSFINLKKWVFTQIQTNEKMKYECNRIINPFLRKFNGKTIWKSMRKIIFPETKHPWIGFKKKSWREWKIVVGVSHALNLKYFFFKWREPLI